MSDNKHPIRNSIISGLMVALILSFARYMLGSWANVLGYAKSAYVKSVTWVFAPVEVPRWAYWVALVLLVVSGISYILTRLKKMPAPGFDFRSFCEGKYFGVFWRWNYDMTGKLGGLTPYCPKCDLEMRETTIVSFRANYGIKYVCENRDFESEDFHCSEHDLRDRVYREIQKELRRRESEARAASK